MPVRERLILTVVLATGPSAYVPICGAKSTAPP
jgi:hypothetical protein